MTDSDDRIDAVIERFLDYLEGVGDEPSLDHLDESERTRVRELIASLKAGRGIDPYASRPSLEELLAGSGLEAADQTTPPAAHEGRDLVADVCRQLTLSTSSRVEIWSDAAAASIGITSDLVARVGAHRFRIVFRPDLISAEDLARLDPAAVAGPIYGAFPDTAGVVVVFPDEDLSSIALDPFDPEYCIAAPAGTLEAPVPRRPVLALGDTIRAFLDELAPQLETNSGFNLFADGEPDSVAVARAAATAAIEACVADGRRAKIEAKRLTWSTLGDAETAAIAELVIDAMRGIDLEELTARIERLTTAA